MYNTILNMVLYLIYHLQGMNCAFGSCRHLYLFIGIFFLKFQCHKNNIQFILC